VLVLGFKGCLECLGVVGVEAGVECFGMFWGISGVALDAWRLGGGVGVVGWHWVFRGVWRCLEVLEVFGGFGGCLGVALGVEAGVGCLGVFEGVWVCWGWSFRFHTSTADLSFFWSF